MFRFLLRPSNKFLTVYDFFTVEYLGFSSGLPKSECADWL